MVAIAFVVAALNLVLFAWFWYRDNGATTVVTPFLLFAALEIFINWPAALLGPTMGWSKDYYPFAVAVLGFLAFLMGVLLTGGILRQRQDLPRSFRAAEIVTASPSSYLIGSLALGAILFCLGLYMYRGLPPIVDTVAAAVRGNALEAALSLTEERRTLTKAHYFGGEYRGQGLIRALLRVGWVYLAGISMCLYVKTRRRRWLALAAVWLVFTFIFVAGEGTRGPFIFAMLALLILVSVIIRLKYRVIGLGAVLLLVAMLAMSLLSTKLRWAVGQENAAVAMATRLGERIAFGNGSNTVAMIELVRDGAWSYRLGEVHLQRLLNAIPGVQSGRPISYELYRAMNPMGTSTTYSSATYLGDIFVDFGPIGIAIVYFSMGILVMVLQQLLFSMRRTVLNIVTMAYLTFTVGFIPLTGVVGVLATLPLLGFTYSIVFLGTRMRLRPRVATAHTRAAESAA